MPREMDISGDWLLAPVKRFDASYDQVADWHQVTVPGHWQEIPQLERYSGKVVYKKHFKFMPATEKRLFLKLNGIFYWHTAYLNGMRLGANEGYFFPSEYEITGMLQKDNELLVEVDCPDEEDKGKKRQITGVFHHWDCIDPETNPGGMWLPVEIMSTGPARLVDPFFYTAYIKGDRTSARIMGRVSVDTEKQADLTLKISFVPRTFEGAPVVFTRQIKKPAGVLTYHYNLDLPDPVLWWTHDHGRPDLYTLRVEALSEDREGPSDVWEQPFGVRTFEMRDYISYLNGKRLYVRGNNYPPGDTRIATMDRARSEMDVDLAIECNMNMLRVHAHVDHPSFYDVCDEKGMLLWQDFPLQWYYGKEAHEQAVRQVEKMVLHLGSRPSVALWCMHNEPFYAPDTRKFIGPIKAARFLASMFIWNSNRDRLDRKLVEKARRLDPHRPSRRCSGERGLLRETGDAHYYYGWYHGPLTWFHKKYQKSPEKLKFITEFGSQSLPNLESARNIMSLDWDSIDWKKLKERHHMQPFFMDRFVNRNKFSDLESYICATQSYQSELNRYYIDRLRALKYKPNGGVVAFLLLDSNPAIQWSIVDYWRVKKSSYHQMKKAFSPVYAFLIIDEKTWRRRSVVTVPVHAVNDTWDEVEAEVTVKVVSAVGDEVINERVEITLSADCMARVVMNPELLLRWEGTYEISVSISWADGAVENSYSVHVG